MTLAVELQPDQQSRRWDDHVGVYETVFEPLTNAFARRALDQLHLRPGDRLLDVAAGAGGAALMAAAAGADVLAVDASPNMVARIRARTMCEHAYAGRVRAEAMDGMALALADASFDAALSVFGVILFPDAGRGMREIARVLRARRSRRSRHMDRHRALRACVAADRRHHICARPATAAGRLAGAVAFS